jgi:hypothetical protein
MLDYLNSIPPLLEMCGFELGHLPDSLGSDLHAAYISLPSRITVR